MPAGPATDEGCICMKLEYSPATSAGSPGAVRCAADWLRAGWRPISRCGVACPGWGCSTSCWSCGCSISCLRKCRICSCCTAC
eukprot:scaffold105140_cov39-Tisochrysis_lutea.AAC.4